MDPNSAKAHNNIGLVFTTLRKYPEAIESYKRSLAIDPNSVAAAHNQSLTYLASGNYKEGWAAYEARYGKPIKPRGFDKPLWHGKESIADKVILLHAEQGLGDTLQFCRYVNMVAPMARQVILLVPSVLKTICQTLVGSPEVYVDGDDLPHFDVHCPLMSLPLAMGTTLETIPNSVPYLYADPRKVAQWKEKLLPLKGLKVGLVWNSGFQRNPNEIDGSNAGRNISLSRRNIALSELEGLVMPGVSLVSLQKGARAENDLRFFNESRSESDSIRDYVSDLHDFSDTAALVEALDLVISVDTSVAHLSGALGKATWILNRYDSCWRWLPIQLTSLWYPTATIYHQPKLNDWTSVTQQVRNDLAEYSKQYE